MSPPALRSSSSKLADQHLDGGADLAAEGGGDFFLRVWRCARAVPGGARRLATPRKRRRSSRATKAARVSGSSLQRLASQTAAPTGLPRGAHTMAHQRPSETRPNGRPGSEQRGETLDRAGGPASLHAAPERMGAPSGTHMPSSRHGFHDRTAAAAAVARVLVSPVSSSGSSSTSDRPRLVVGLAGRRSRPHGHRSVRRRPRSAPPVTGAFDEGVVPVSASRARWATERALTPLSSSSCVNRGAYLGRGRLRQPREARRPGLVRDRDGQEGAGLLEQLEPGVPSAAASEVVIRLRDG